MSSRLDSVDRAQLAQLRRHVEEGYAGGADLDIEGQLHRVGFGIQEGRRMLTVGRRVAGQWAHPDPLVWAEIVAVFDIPSMVMDENPQNILSAFEVFRS